MNDRLLFISVVGTQVLGALEPLLVLHEKFGPMPVRLLHTDRTLPEAERLRDYIHAHNLGTCELLKVAMFPAGEGSVVEVLADLAREAGEDGRRICFNLDGGLNYLIAAAMLELAKHDALCIQCSRDRAVLTDLRDDSHHALRLAEPLLPEEILQLQGVPYTLEGANPDEAAFPFSRLIKQAGLTLPANGLQNVRIDNLVFDYVWNTGNNRLTFLKDWRFNSGDPDQQRMRMRDFAQWATDRTRGGHLYDRDIYAIVQDDKVLQRLQDDSGGKIKPIFYVAPRGNRGVPNSEAIDSLRDIFRQKPPKVREDTLKVPASPQLPPLRDDTLVVCVGTDLYTTILAICSHKPKHVLLARSRSNPAVEKYAERICQAARQLGVQSITPVEFKLEGTYAGVVLPAAENSTARVVVNITPGTKGQCGMLTRWAQRNGYEVWSIHGRNGVCTPLLAPPRATPLPLVTCDPALLFRLMGQELRSPGLSERDLSPDFDWLDALLEFMRQLDAHGLDLNQAFEKSYLRDGANKLRKTGGCTWELQLDGKSYRFKREGKGAWFEKLCARALLNAGAAHVRLNLKLEWNEDNLQALTRKHGEGKVHHRREFDVIGSFGGQLVLVSAKSYSLRNPEPIKDCVSLDDAIQDARDAGSVMDKFALSIVTHMGSRKQSPDPRVALLTWRDLCYPQKLAMQIQALAKSRSTTAREG